MKKLAFIVAPTPKAQALGALLATSPLCNNAKPEDADILVVLGGDGFMLRTLHTYQPLNKPAYGINCGTVGFLMNDQPSSPHQLLKRVEQAVSTPLHPLKMTAYSAEGVFIHHAINEVSLLRETHQAAKIRIIINNVERLPLFVGDGLIVATPAGSTAYNLSAQGPILPLGSSLIAMTPLCAFRPRLWRGALLPQTVQVCLEILESDRRFVSATADDQTVSKVNRVDICQDLGLNYLLLFDRGHNLEERILKEQFKSP
ncbi:NAD kinase [Candidatus Finniella inopinata]|uniref:NAD kinase n=1 Tax=Candidatus Finniella inopinata TaxID=1696036 RepID=A0A4Q7DH35_9PROT|nr:NAD kinase [Candidatus Finniella inopinata]RZI46231.1 NAD kinase [Candidatus Finniella inopinata]